MDWLVLCLCVFLSLLISFVFVCVSVTAYDLTGWDRKT